MKISEEDKLKIQLARLKGEFVGMLKGILWWDIPKELKERIEEVIKRNEEV